MIGKWISIDGCEGSGKTTLVSELKKIKPNLVYVPEFSDSIMGRVLEESVKSDPYIISDSIIGAGLLFLSDYFAMVETVIKPNLLRGNHVVSDRGFTTKMAVNCAVISDRYEEQIVKNFLHELFKLSPIPNCSIILDPPFDVIRKRLIDKDGHWDDERSKFISLSKIMINEFSDSMGLYKKVIIDETQVSDVIAWLASYLV